MIARVRPEQLYRFDQTCRVKAIATAADLGIQARLSINFAPNAVYEPVETLAECQALRDMGITLFQGYLFAKPALEALPVVADELWESLEPPAG